MCSCKLLFSIFFTIKSETHVAFMYKQYQLVLLFLATSNSFQTHMQISTIINWCIPLPYTQNTSFGCWGIHLNQILIPVILLPQNHILDQHLYLGWYDQTPWPLHDQMQSGSTQEYKCTFKCIVKYTKRDPDFLY